jgi:tetratricopeptide (TPR) repeat protein
LWSFPAIEIITVSIVKAPLQVKGNFFIIANLSPLAGRVVDAAAVGNQNRTQYKRDNNGDAQHRHELKTNELADWLTHAPEFLKKNASSIIGVALIVVGIITWPMFTRMRAASDIAKSAAVTESIQNLERDIYSVVQAAEQDDETRRQATGALLVNANALLDQADKADNPDLAALARIKAAQALRTELHVRAERVEVGEIQTRIGQAQEAYNKALTSATTPTLKAMAKLGLGLCAEELGQRDAAAALYRDIIATPEFASTVVPAQAQGRLDGLEENLESFVFAPAPAPAETATPVEINVTTSAETAPPTQPQAPAEAAPVQEPAQ